MGAPWRPRGPDDLNEDQRARIRYQVLSSLRGREISLADRLYDVLAVVALPAPHLVRLALGAVVVVGLVAGATVASADSLPTEPLYPVKLATEQIRLALAQSAQDRASVQLSMAEHRLVEAERLALEGREQDALVAGSTYGAELAGAAAELASIESTDPQAAAVVAQLTQRLAEQQSHASQVAAQLAGDPSAAAIAPVFRTVALFAPTRPSGITVSEAIAQHAADVAGQLAAAADEIATQSEDGSGRERGDAAEADLRRGAARAGAPAGDAAPKGRPAAEAAPDAGRPAAEKKKDAAPPAGPAEAPTAPQGPKEAVVAPQAERSSPGRSAVDPHVAREAADRAKQEAEKAKEAAQKAKEKAKEAAQKAKEKQRPTAHGDAENDKERGKGRP